MKYFMMCHSDNLKSDHANVVHITEEVGKFMNVAKSNLKCIDLNFPTSYEKWASNYYEKVLIGTRCYDMHNKKGTCILVQTTELMGENKEDDIEFQQSSLEA